jgi:Ax21 family sulfation-dependent quorum factor
VDLVSQVAYQSVDFGGSTQKHDGYTAEVGVRGALTPMLEGYAGAGYGDLEHSNGEFYAKLGTQMKFNQNWGVAGDVKFISGDTQWFVGPRLSW